MPIVTGGKTASEVPLERVVRLLLGICPAKSMHTRFQAARNLPVWPSFMAGELDAMKEWQGQGERFPSVLLKSFGAARIPDIRQNIRRGMYHCMAVPAGARVIHY